MNNGKRQFRIARRRLDRRIHGEIASEIINDWKEWMADNPKDEEWLWHDADRIRDLIEGLTDLKEGRYVEDESI